MKYVMICVLIACVSLLQGCDSAKTTKIVNAVEQHEVLLRAIVTVSVGKIVTAHPEYAKPLQDAARVARVIVTAEQDVRTGDVITFLRTSLMIAPKTDEEKILLRVAIEAIVDEIQLLMVKIQPDNARLLADRVLQWVENATIIPDKKR